MRTLTMKLNLSHRCPAAGSTHEPEQLNVRTLMSETDDQQTLLCRPPSADTVIFWRSDSKRAGEHVVDNWKQTPEGEEEGAFTQRPQ